MEEGWERPPRLDIEPEELQRLIAPAFPGRRIEAWAPISTGLANTNLRFRVSDDAGSYVLRIHTRDRAAARRERGLMHHLGTGATHRVPVAPLVYSDPGEREGRYAYSIWRFVEGELLQELFKSLQPQELVDIAGECGNTLAAIGAARGFDACGELGANLEVVSEYGPPSRFVPDVIHRGLYAGRAGERLGEALRDELWAAVERSLHLLGAVDGRYVLVHGDYKRSNILMRRRGGSWRVAAVLDWEFAFAGPPIVDVGLFLRAGGALPGGFAAAFASGFRGAGGELPPDWLPTSRLVDLVSQVIFLDDARDQPRRYAETVSVVKETVRILA